MPQVKADREARHPASSERATPVDGSGNPLRDAAYQIHAARQEEREEFRVERPRPGGVFRGKVERWERGERGLVATNRQHKVVANSGAIVGADQLRSVCSQCGGYADDLIPSTLSGLPLCTQCRHYLVYPHGTEVLSSAEYQSAAHNYNSWSAARAFGGGWRKALKPGIPRKP